MTRWGWAVPSVTRSQVDRAGRVLAQSSAAPHPLVVGRPLAVIDVWRSAHSFPLNTLQMLLRKRVGRMNVPEVVVAQRLKRTPSILAKLRRFPSMKLSRMQDIGGPRAILPGIEDVDELRRRYLQGDRRSAHTFVAEKDYIRQPKASGYRGIHLIYRYGSLENPEYNGLQIEIQLRTRLQHAWATAVETVGTFLGQSLKSSEAPKAGCASSSWQDRSSHGRKAAQPRPMSPLTPPRCWQKRERLLRTREWGHAFRHSVSPSMSWARKRNRRSASRGRTETSCSSPPTLSPPCGAPFRITSVIRGRSSRRCAASSRREVKEAGPTPARNRLPHGLRIPEQVTVRAPEPLTLVLHGAAEQYTERSGFRPGSTSGSPTSGRARTPCS